MPTIECSKGELLATGQLSNSSPNLLHTHLTHIQTSKPCMAFYSFVHQTKKPSVLQQVSFVSWGLSGDRFPDIGPQSLSNLPQHSCASFCNVHSGMLKNFLFYKSPSEKGVQWRGNLTFFCSFQWLFDEILHQKWLVKRGA